MDEQDRLRLEALIARRNSVAIEDFERLVCHLRRKRLDESGVEFDVADWLAPEEPWYLEARLIAAEAALEWLEPRARFNLPDLRRFAKGKPCQIRLPGVCRDVEPHERTVLCHVRRSQVGGTARKPCDLSAFIGCYWCHRVYDREASPPPGMLREYIEVSALDAMVRTHELYRQEWGFQ